MALNKIKLKQDIQDLLKKIKEEKGSENEFAQGLADIIDAYIKTATVTVNTQGVGNMGVPVVSSGTGVIS